MKGDLTRRSLWPIAGAAALAGYAGIQEALKKPETATHPISPVTIVKCPSYAEDIASRLRAGIQACGLEVRGKTVLLKPNLVEFDRLTAINTDVSVVEAALEVFRSLGAADVRIGEGPGHRRDTYEIAGLARYRSEIPKFDDLFTDLNRDDVSEVKKFADEESIFLPNTALRADLIVSLAKMKTHHWAGATLSMKNFFGLVPGSVYGWPKNKLHIVGIPQSIVELNRIFRRTFAIVDGVVGMEGNGPIQGAPKNSGVLVMGSDLTAVDATCCRIMGIDPAQVEYLKLARFLGNTVEPRIEQRGETISAVRNNFALIEQFASIRLPSS